MKILGSTQYVDLAKQKEPWYQLDVINMWDWGTKSICFQELSGTLISYCLKINTPIDGKSYQSTIVHLINDEMKAEIIKMGYIIK